MTEKRERRVRGAAQVQISYAEAFSVMRQIINYHQNQGDSHLFDENDAEKLERMGMDIRQLIGAKKRKVV